MSAILKIFGTGRLGTWYLILDCGHWYHWTGESAPEAGELDCPSCNLPVVETPSA